MQRRATAKAIASMHDPIGLWVMTLGVLIGASMAIFL